MYICKYVIYIYIIEKKGKKKNKKKEKKKIRKKI